MDDLHCWKCGASLRALPLPLGRRAECTACRAELHVCRMCRHYDTGKAKQCRERAADEVRDKTRANFCEWFQPAPRSADASGKPDAPSRRELDKLFGA